MEVILKESIRPLMGVHQQGEIALCVMVLLRVAVHRTVEISAAVNYVHDLLDAMAGKETTMNKDLKEEFERAFVAMPPQMKETVIWVIQHFDIVKTLAKYEPMSDDKLDVFAKSSLEKGEYFLFITAEYAKLLRKEERAGISTSEGNDSSTSLSGLLP